MTPRSSGASPEPRRAGVAEEKSSSESVASESTVPLLACCWQRSRGLECARMTVPPRGADNRRPGPCGWARRGAAPHAGNGAEHPLHLLAFADDLTTLPLITSTAGWTSASGTSWIARGRSVGGSGSQSAHRQISIPADCCGRGPRIPEDDWARGAAERTHPAGVGEDRTTKLWKRKDPGGRSADFMGREAFHTNDIVIRRRATPVRQPGDEDVVCARTYSWCHLPRGRRGSEASRPSAN